MRGLLMRFLRVVVSFDLIFDLSVKLIQTYKRVLGKNMSFDSLAGRSAVKLLRKFQ